LTSQDSFLTTESDGTGAFEVAGYRTINLKCPYCGRFFVFHIVPAGGFTVRFQCDNCQRYFEISNDKAYKLERNHTRWKQDDV